MHTQSIQASRKQETAGSQKKENLIILRRHLRTVLAHRHNSAHPTHTLYQHRSGVVSVHEDIERRVRDLAVYIIDNNATVRTAALRFGVSKSTVHKDLTERLKSVDRQLYARARTVLERNKAERHLRGGEATRKKYRGD